MLRTIQVFALFLVLAVASSATIAQGVPTLAELRRVTDAAMTKVGKGDIEGGLQVIRPLTIIPSAEFDVMLGQIPLQLPGMSVRFGASIGHEFIKEDKLGDSLARLVYIHKFEKHATRWLFFAYRGKSGWVINTFRFDDKWHELF